jgi:hypothetical protein
MRFAAGGALVNESKNLPVLKHRGNINLVGGPYKRTLGRGMNRKVIF